jgi:hypothetical protein
MDEADIGFSELVDVNNAVVSVSLRGTGTIGQADCIDSYQ